MDLLLIENINKKLSKKKQKTLQQESDQPLFIQQFDSISLWDCNPCMVHSW